MWPFNTKTISREQWKELVLIWHKAFNHWDRHSFCSQICGFAFPFGITSLIYIIALFAWTHNQILWSCFWNRKTILIHQDDDTIIVIQLSLILCLTTTHLLLHKHKTTMRCFWAHSIKHNHSVFFLQRCLRAHRSNVDLWDFSQKCLILCNVDKEMQEDWTLFWNSF